MYSIVEVPFHLGVEGIAVGKGPERLLRSGADNILAHHSIPAPVTHVRMRDLRSRGLDAVLDINRMQRYAVKGAVEQETIPVVLAGNCNSCLGTLAGLPEARMGVVWFDRHADFQTPDTSPSGNLEGMSLAIASGHCHNDLRERIGMMDAIREENIVLAGVRDIEPGERERLEASWVSVHAADSLGLLPVALDQLRERVDAVYMHIDTDFLGGVERPEMLIRLVRETLPVAAVGVTNYNPELDPSGEWERAILAAISALAAVTQ